MGINAIGKVAVGKIVGFGQPWNPFSKKTKLIVKLEGFTVNVFVDNGRLDYFRKKYEEGSPVAVGFYGREWHIGSPSDPAPEISPALEEGDLSLLQHEMGDFNLIELIGTPDKGLIAQWKKPEAWGKDDLKGLSDNVEEYNEYLRSVEANIKDNGNEILDNIGLAHLAANELQQPKAGGKKKHNWASGLDNRLNTIIAQNKVILANQEELMRLLRKTAPGERPAGRTKNKFN